MRYQEKKNRRSDVKNNELFRLLRKGITTDLDLHLYGKASKNNLYALKKRLYDSLIDYIASKSFEGETNEELSILKYLLASRIFFENKHYKIAFKTLAKAENMAIHLLEDVCPKILEGSGATAFKIRLWESEETCAEVAREGH